MDHNNDNACGFQTKKLKTDNTESKQLINLSVQPPTLQHIIISSLVAQLWTDPIILSYIDEILTKPRKEFGNMLSSDKTFIKMKARLNEKISQMALPDFLQSKVRTAIVPMGFRLIKFFQDERNHRCRAISCDLHEFLLIGAKIRWTMIGVIDKAKTAKEIITSEIYIDDAATLYEWACKYCFEDCIRDLWTKFGPFSLPYVETEDDYSYKISLYWNCRLSDDMTIFYQFFDHDEDNDDKSSENFIMIQGAITNGNLSAVKYFWSKLTRVEMDFILKKSDFFLFRYKFNDEPTFTIDDEKVDVLMFLLTQLQSRNMLEDFFKFSSFHILNLLSMRWSLVTVFLSIFKVVVGYLRAHKYEDLMFDIACQIGKFSGADEAILQIWSLSPQTLKNHFMRDIENSTTIVYKFLLTNNFDAIEVFLKDVSFYDKRNIVLNMIPSKNFGYFVDLIVADKMESFDTFAKKYFNSYEEFQHLKQQIMFGYGRELFYHLLKFFKPQDTEKLFQWAFQSNDEIERYKREVLNKTDVYIALLESGHYESIDQFLDWSFETEDEKLEFKKSFISENNLHNLNKVLSNIFSQSYPKWESFETLLNVSLPTSDEVCQVKDSFLNEIHYIFHHSKFEFSTKVLNWCFGSAEEVRLFKIKLMVSEKGIIMISNVLQMTGSFYLSYGKIREMAKWFSPLSSQEVADFKVLVESYLNKKFISIMPKELRAFIYLLECYADKYDGESSDINFVDDAVLKEILFDYYVFNYKYCHGNNCLLEEK